MSRDQWKWVGVIAALGGFVGTCGIAPHILFSAERGEWSWFFNSYDEGFYGWTALTNPGLHRLLTSVVVGFLAFLTGGSPSGAMIAADFVLPASLAVVWGWALLPVSRTATGLVARVLAVLVAAEVVAFRSSSSPTYLGFPWVRDLFERLDPRADGIFVFGNETTVFWLFRTPEPQVSWVVFALLAGCAIRLLQGYARRKFMFYCGALALCCFGYFFIVLPICGALVLAGAGIAASDRRLAIRIALPALLTIGTVIALASAFAAASGAGQLLIESRRPVLMVSGFIGLLVSGGFVFSALRKRNLDPLGWFALALAISPILMMNQHVLTGRMIYLLNFENFAFPQMVVLAVCMAPFLFKNENVKERQLHEGRVVLATLLSVLCASALVYSQQMGFQSHLQTNRDLESYASAIEGAELATGDVIAVDDLFIAEMLPLKLGWQPNFLVERAMYFNEPVERLKSPDDVPLKRREWQARFFEYLVLTGVTPEEFERRLGTLSDPEDPDYRSRFLVGGMLYNPADFWAAMTHYRGLRLDWISGQRAGLKADYADFREAYRLGRDVVVVGKWDGTDFERYREFGRVRKLGQDRTPKEARAARVLPRP